MIKGVAAASARRRARLRNKKRPALFRRFVVRLGVSVVVPGVRIFDRPRLAMPPRPCDLHSLPPHGILACSTGSRSCAPTSAPRGERRRRLGWTRGSSSVISDVTRTCARAVDRRPTSQHTGPFSAFRSRRFSFFAALSYTRTASTRNPRDAARLSFLGSRLDSLDSHVIHHPTARTPVLRRKRTRRPRTSPSLSASRSPR